MVTEEDIWQLLENVPDPEIPVLSVVDLGIVRTVTVINQKEIRVIVTPTYTGCPAVKTIEQDIKKKLESEGFIGMVETTLHPAWNTDWITDRGRERLKAYGIAPPVNEVDKNTLFSKPTIVPCPRCNSTNTKMISQFGSTACKAHYQCNDCMEPFDYFKCLK